MGYNFTWSFDVKAIINVYNYLQNYLGPANGIQINIFNCFPGYVIT